MRNAESHHTDEKLVDEFKAGSMEAMDKIVARYERPLFTFGMKMCGQRQDAEDVAQDTFMSAFRYLDRFRGETKLKNWLFKIAARACIKKRRKKKAEPDRLLSLDMPAEDDGNGNRYDIPDWSNDPSGKLLNTELNARQAVIQQQKGTIARLVWACGGPPEGDWLDSSPGDFKPRTDGYDLMWGKLDPETGQMQTWQWFRV